MLASNMFLPSLVPVPPAEPRRGEVAPHPRAKQSKSIVSDVLPHIAPPTEPRPAGHKVRPRSVRYVMHQASNIEQLDGSTAVAAPASSANATMGSKDVASQVPIEGACEDKDSTATSETLSGEGDAQAIQAWIHGLTVPKSERFCRPLALLTLADYGSVDDGSAQDGNSDVASIGDETCLELRLQELHGMMYHTNLLRYQEQLCRRAVTINLWELYFVLRHPGIHQRWPRAVFHGVAVFLDPHVHEVRGRDGAWLDEGHLDTLRGLFCEALVQSM